MKVKELFVIAKALNISNDDSLSKDEKVSLIDELQYEFLANSGHSEEEILEIKEVSKNIAHEIYSKYTEDI